MSKQIRRWLSAIAIAKVLFEEEGYHCLYLEEIEEFIKEAKIVQSKHLKTLSHTFNGGGEFEPKKTTSSGQKLDLSKEDV